MNTEPLRTIACSYSSHLQTVLHRVEPPTCDFRGLVETTAKGVLGDKALVAVAETRGQVGPSRPRTHVTGFGPVTIPGLGVEKAVTVFCHLPAPLDLQMPCTVYSFL